MLILRLQPVGKKHQKIYRIVLQEKRDKLNGKTILNFGWWNPRLNEGNFDAEKINFYISKGSHVSDTLWNLLVNKGIIKAKKRPINISVGGKKKKKAE